jgi:transposase
LACCVAVARPSGWEAVALRSANRVLDDLALPFDNHQAERDLRGLKVHQKVAKCFRSDTGAAAFARLRGYLATLRKQGQALLAALETVFAGRPLYPAFG